MTLADKLISLNNALSTIDALLLDCDNRVNTKVYYSLIEKVAEYEALSGEWLEACDNSR